MQSTTQPKCVHPPRKSCEGCPWRGPRVGGKGALDAPFVVVGESPGGEERRKGYPFAGPSGKVLHALIPEEECLIINALECVPPSGDKKAKLLGVATQCCQKRVLDTIAQHPRTIILALGNAALWSLTGDFSLKITQNRGKFFSTPMATHGILAAVHPAALMRGTGSYRQWKADILYALDIARGGKPREWIKPEWIHVKSLQQATTIAWKLRKETELTGDIETSSLHVHEGRILSIGISTDGEKVYCFTPKHIKVLKPLLESQKIKWCWHNGKFDVQWFHALGINARVDDDTMLMSYALDETSGIHDLETVASDLLGAPDYKHMLKPYLPKKDTSYDQVPEAVLLEYMSIDVANTARIRSILRERVRSDKHAEKLYTKVLIPASALIAEIESNGVYVDLEMVEENSRILQAEIDVLQAQINEEVGFPVNPNSPKQVKHVLYTHYRLPTKFGKDTDKKTLAKLPQTPFVKLLLKYRKVKKQYGTYVKSVYKHLGPDGRIHPTFLLHGTVTGRLASRKPNMQNIPRDSSIRRQFGATPGYVLIECDLSQAELRSLACLSGDPGLLEIYRSGKDLHAEVVAAIFGPEYVDEDHPEHKEKRVLAKNINFGIVYGITAAGLKDQTKQPIEECTRMINGWYARFPVAAEFIKKCRATPSKMQVIHTCFGRQKRVGMVTRENLHSLQNEAANFPHQSIASDITLMTATRIFRRLKLKGVRIVNLIHDAILVEAPNKPEVIQWAAKYITEEMAKTPPMWGLKRVPFLADAKVGEQWGKLENYKIAA